MKNKSNKPNISSAIKKIDEKSEYHDLGIDVEKGLEELKRSNKENEISEFNN